MEDNERKETDQRWRISLLFLYVRYSIYKDMDCY